MARTLHLYYGATPNQGNNPYFIYPHAEYMAACGNASVQSLDVDIDNYRINSNVIKVQEPKTALFTASTNATYAIDEEHHKVGTKIVFDYWRCYFVRSIDYQSEMAILRCDVDLWGTYYRNATISNIVVKRCNRAISEGVYDDIKHTNGTLYYGDKIGPIARPISDFCVVFLVSLVLQTSWFGSDPLTQSVMLYLPLEEVGAKTGSAWADMDIIEKVRFVIGGLKSASAGAANDNNLSVLRCWILPKDCVSAGAYGLAAIKGTSPFVGEASHDYQFKDVPTARPVTKTKYFDFTDFVAGTAPEKSYPNIDIQAGAIGHTMPLTRYINDKGITYRVITESDAVRVQVEQGNKIQDISGAFELNINVNNQMGTSAQETSKNLSKLLSFVSSTTMGYLAKGVMGGAVGAGLGFAKTLAGSLERSAANSPSSGNGDASTSYSLNDAEYVAYPFVVSVAQSIDDERERARMEGASFDTCVDSLDGIKTFALLGEKEGFEKTYVQADATIAGVPMDAMEKIKGELAKGIYIE